MHEHYMPPITVPSTNMAISWCTSDDDLIALPVARNTTSKYARKHGRVDEGNRINSATLKK